MDHALFHLLHFTLPWPKLKLKLNYGFLHPTLPSHAVFPNQDEVTTFPAFLSPRMPWAYAFLFTSSGKIQRTYRFPASKKWQRNHLESRKECTCASVGFFQKGRKGCMHSNKKCSSCRSTEETTAIEKEHDSHKNRTHSIFLLDLLELAYIHISVVLVHSYTYVLAIHLLASTAHVASWPRTHT